MFVHLRLHTEFSIVDGTSRIDEVVAAARADRQPALAITDFGNLFGAVKFYKAARAAGLKPLLGAEIAVQGLGRDAQAVSRLVLLVQDRAGYLNLCELLARAWTRNIVKGHGVCTAEWLAERGAGLIALAGAQSGAVGQALLQGDAVRAGEVAARLAGLFPGRFYLELQRAGRPDDEAHVVAAVQLAARMKLPVVATHPVQFTAADGYQAHEARVCIAEGEILGNPRRVRRFTREQYFKSSAQMEALFADVPSAIANTAEIARRCSLTLELGKAKLPHFPTPAGVPVEQHLRTLSQQGLEERLAQRYPDAAKRDAERQRYRERLEFELNTIVTMGFPGYFLIVADFINWARANGCPVGPGRGSGAGSLVAYALKITDLDPLQYNLLFERFLNPERVSMPDFDIDFCQANRDRVIDYVKAKYGKDAVSQIATFGTMAARAAIRDVGRVLDMSYTFCDGISKLIPMKPGQHVTIESALKQEPVLAERMAREDEVRELLGMAQQLEGLSRNVGMHAGGVVIAPSKLTDFTPLYQQPGGDSAISHYDKDDVEAIGLVKFDFLGLATLTILELAKEMIRARHPHRAGFTFEALPLDDAATYQLFADAKTEAVFQFESRGMQAMLRDAKPTRLEDLIAMNALFRPGPMELIPTYVARKHGREEVRYPDPRVEAILSETYGIMVYQEQVMQIAQVLGGYSLGGADLLRRAMGKKKKEEMDAQRAVFREGAAKKGLDAHKADEVFDLMEKFAGYGFNKSHSAAYALLAYHTGWLKVHHTAEFYAANMTVEMDSTDKLKLLFGDAQKMGIAFEPPDVNRGAYRFEPVSDKVVRYGLGAVKGTGQQAIEAVIAARGEGGPFTSLYDFCVRVDRAKINKRAVDALVKAGAFDSLQLNRAALAASLDRAFDFAAAAQANEHQGGLFDMGDSHAASTQEPALVDAVPWTLKERLGFEKAAVGFYMSGHLFDEAGAEVRRFVKAKLEDVDAGRIDRNESRTFAGIVGDLRVINGNRGKLAIFKLDDRTGTIECTADEPVLNAARQLLKDDELVIVHGKVQPDRFTGGWRLNVTQVWDLATARCRFGKKVHVLVNGGGLDIPRLLRDFPPQVERSENGERRRGVPLQVSVVANAEEQAWAADFELGPEIMIYPSDAALASCAAQAHEGRVQVVYG